MESTVEKVIKTAIHEDYDDPMMFHDELSKRPKFLMQQKLGVEPIS